MNVVVGECSVALLLSCSVKARVRNKIYPEAGR